MGSRQWWERQRAEGKDHDGRSDGDQALEGAGAAHGAPGQISRTLGTRVRFLEPVGVTRATSSMRTPPRPR